MSLRVGIVGLPNVGKSTLFNALLKKQAALVANYPFATIEPNVGVVEVPDERLEKLADVIERDSSTSLGMTSGGGIGVTKRPPIKYATVEFVDIAGLVKGAAEGAGLGNKFLAHIREVDVIVQLMRDFNDGDVVKEGSVDPKSDYEVVTDELILKDLETLMRVKDSKELRMKGQEKRKAVIDRLCDALNSGKRAAEVVSEEDEELVRDLCLLTSKKEIKVLNVSETDPRLAEGVGENGEVVICAKVEAEVAALSPDEAREYLQALGIEESGLNKLIRKAYETLGLISFLTAGEMESRAWTIRTGMKAPQAAGVIHTDFEKKFIKAKCCDYADFVSLGGWKNAAEKGKVRMEGRDYVMKDGDVVEFMVGS